MYNRFKNAFDKNLDINENSNFYNICSIKKKLIEFLINPRLYKQERDSCLEKLNHVFFYILSFLFKVQKNYFSSLFSVHNLEKLISFSWLLDDPKEKGFFEETGKNYISLLYLFLTLSTSLPIKNYNIKN
jgi:hypothetical protein